jgi:hypothetical protein
MATNTAVKISFWPIPRIGRSTLLPPDIIREMIEATLEAIKRTLASGVQSYNIGSRGLTRLSLKDLMDALDFWRKELEIAEGGSSIVAKRAVPTDY